MSPIFPNGILSTALTAESQDHQAAAALYWFQINFEPVPAQEHLRPSEERLRFYIDGEPIMIGRLKIAPSAAEEADFRAFAEADPVEALSTEFVGIIPPATLIELADGLFARSKQWRFVPLPIELDDAAIHKSAAATRDVQRLHDHLESPPSGSAAPGQNYWPGAELIDDLRRDVAQITRGMKALAAAPLPPVVEVQEQVRRVIKIRNKVSLWLAEGFVRGLGAAAATAVVAAAAIWWNTLFHLLTTALQSITAWLASMVGS